MTVAKVFSMTKDEPDILEEFILYYGGLVGLSNVYIADNNSTDPKVHFLLQYYQKKGLNVRYQVDRFRDKGNYLVEWSQEFPQLDFAFYVDTDEFVVLNTREEPFSLTARKEALMKYLKELKRKHPEQCAFSYRYWMFARQTKPLYNNLFKEQVYFSAYISESERKYSDRYGARKRWKNKRFFRPHSLISLDPGFHHGTWVRRREGSEEVVPTRLVLLHYYLRSVPILLNKARNLLRSEGYPTSVKEIAKIYHKATVARHKMEHLLRYQRWGIKGFLQRTERAIKTHCVYSAIERARRHFR